MDFLEKTTQSFEVVVIYLKIFFSPSFQVRLQPPPSEDRPHPLGVPLNRRSGQRILQPEHQLNGVPSWNPTGKYFYKIEI